MDELLCKALDEIYETEFDKYKTRKKHFFSFKHRRMMRKLFKELDAKPKSEVTTEVYTYKAKKRRPAALVIAIIFSVLLSIVAGAVAIYSFGFKKQTDHTIAFSENIENAPTSVEYVYVIEPLPDGYIESTRTKGMLFCDITYQKDKDILKLSQYAKKDYMCSYNTEEYDIEKIDVAGHDGFIIEFKDDTVLVWDNGDYILELYGTLDKNELLDLAKSTKIEKI
jgi:hypothetical protein